MPTTRPHRRAVAAIGSLAALTTAFGVVLVAPPAGADATITVTTVDDVVDLGDGLTSLREAITEASDATGTVTVELGANATYNLTRCHADPAETDDTNERGDLDFVGAVSSTLVLSGTNVSIVQQCAERVVDVVDLDDQLEVLGTTIANGVEHLGGGIRGGDVTLGPGAVISGNTASGVGSLGGGIHSSGTVRLDGAVVTGNRADEGGGIYAEDGVVVTDSSIVDNFAWVRGGGVLTPGDASFTSSVVSLNRAGNGGGGSGIAGGVHADTVTSVGSDYRQNAAELQAGAVYGATSVSSSGDTFTYNVVEDTYGGAIFGRAVTATGSTLRRNYAGAGGAIAATTAVVLTDSTLNENVAQNGSGGAVAAVTGVQATGTEFDGNTATRYGGAIYLRNSDAQLITVELTGSTLNRNEAELDGGAVHAFNDTPEGVGAVVAANSTLEGNVGRQGGAIDAETATLSRTTVADNTAEAVGGVRATSQATLIESTISGNSALQAGGLLSGDLEAHRTTFSDNHATDGTQGEAGAIAAVDALLVNSTVSDNSAVVSGGGIQARHLELVHTTVADNAVTAPEGIGANVYVRSAPGDPGNLTARSTILAGPAAGSCTFDDGATATSEGFNLDSGTSCQLDGADDLTSVADVGLAALADNGGFNLTRMPAADSPAVDLEAGGTCEVATDQRTIARPLGAGCDSGAVERSPEPPPPPPPPATLEVSVSAACSADERVASVEVSTSGAGDLTLDVRVDGVRAVDDHVVADG
ncbi:MAG: choice-of-anchor Q domain-containing protein, partial [Acidimicrobiia bacterium]